MRNGALFHLLLAFSLALVGCEPANEVLVDEWGVPHVYANTDDDLAYGFAYAQMHNHGNRILELYGRARGTAAELWGVAYVESDKYVWTMGIPAYAAAEYDAAPADQRAMVDAFARGINAYAERHADELDPALSRVLPVSGEDVTRHIAYATHFGLYINAERVAQIRDAFVMATSADASAVPSPGSNGWVLGGSRTQSGSPLLLSNTHLPWPNYAGAEHLTWHEAHLVGPDLDIYGVGLVGTPLLTYGFNDEKAWTITALPAGPGYFRVFDVYLLSGDATSYAFGPEMRPYEEESKTLQVRQPDGTFTPESFVVRRSVHGPVIAAAGPVALAVRVPVPESLLGTQLWDMARAHDMEEFRAALASPATPPVNILYADRDGNVLYTMTGVFPDRTGEPPLVGAAANGSNPASLWTRMLSRDRIPEVVNPPADWLQSSNDPPWMVTEGGAAPSPVDYPSDWPSRSVISPRNVRSRKLIDTLSSATIDDVIAAKFSTYSELADRVVDDLVAASSTGSALAREAGAVLEAWDRCFDAGSRGALLFAHWVTQLQPNAMAGVMVPEAVYATPYDPNDPLATPRGLADPTTAVAALEAAASAVQAAFGALDAPWGDWVRFRYGGMDLPAYGAPADVFGLFTGVFVTRAQDGTLTTNGGDTWVMAIDYSDPDGARAVMPYGNSTQGSSPHLADQLDLYANQTLRPIWRERGVVQSHTELRMPLP